MTNREWLSSLSDDYLAMWLCNKYKEFTVVPIDENWKEIITKEVGVKNVVDDCGNIVSIVKHWLGEERK